ncbi:MAG TPA: rod shape-determining protein RodA [Gammaproteobacteria bacterium]|nr:rod shape-determining protein RodA [Gammaproteobacteria bacterium]
MLSDSQRLSSGLQRQSWLQRVLHLDSVLLAGLLVIAGIGLAILYSASGQEMQEVKKQALRLTIAFGVMLAAAQISPTQLRRWSPWLYGATVLMLALVILLGDVGKGAQRWLDLGVIRFQPSEIMKLALPMMVAWFLGNSILPPRWPQVLAVLAMIAVPTALIFAQPDLGTAILVATAGLAALYLAGLRWRLIIGTLIAIVPLALLMWKFGMHHYQKQRVLTFLDPARDPLGAGYHTIQSTIALGSGGLFGKGWLHGTQSHLEFLPERHTDFIFAVFGEEFGLVGALVLVILYFFVILRGLYIAVNAQDTYSRLLAGSISLTFFVYVFVNMGMVAGLLPVVGVPLPLVSYGGTSMVTLLASFGMLMSIQTHRKIWST